MIAIEIYETVFYLAVALWPSEVFLFLVRMLVSEETSIVRNMINNRIEWEARIEWKYIVMDSNK